MRFRTALVLSVIMGLAGVARADEPNAADRESARVAFAQGNKLRDEGNVRGALEQYKAAYALAPTPVTALEVGRAELDLGQLVEAREVLLRAESIAQVRTESAKSQAARREATTLAAGLAQRIPKITLRIVGSVDQVMVTVDGVTIPHEAIGVARSVNPGRHAVMGIANGHTAQSSIDVKEGEAREVVLDVTSITSQHNAVTTPIVNVPQGTGSGVVAFNSPEDGHAWTLRDPSGHDVCKLPCAQSLGFATGWFVARDDGERVIVPAGLAILPGMSAQVTPSGPGGNAVVGWSLIGVGAVAAIVSPFFFTMQDNGAASALFLSFLLGGVTIASVGAIVLGLSHGAMLTRTDMGFPMRIAHRSGVTIRLSPGGVVGVF